VADDPWKPSGDSVLAGYVSVETLGNVVAFAMLAEVALRLTGLAIGEVALGLVDPDALGEGGPSSTLSTVLLLVGGLAQLGFAGVALIAMPLWIYWHYRAAANLVAFGDRLEYTPAWHAGWWFVPFANLVMPFRAMVELYNASTLTGTDADDERSVTPPRFTAWWVCWIIGNIAGNISFRLSEDLQATMVVDLVGEPIAVAATLLYVRFVREISAGQARRTAR
jgi:hypothetical protein